MRTLFSFVSSPDRRRPLLPAGGGQPHMSRKPNNQARNREIAKRVRAGEAPKAIAPDYGLSAARVRRIFQKERARPNEPRSWKPVGRLGMP